jgi:hypothetical protein
MAIRDAGGSLIIDDPGPRIRARYRRSIYHLANSGLLPQGQRLQYTGRGQGNLVVSIMHVKGRPERKRVAVRDPIRIPTRLQRIHPLIQATRDMASGSGWIDTCGSEGVLHVKVHSENLRRCLLLIQALIGEAEQRDYQVTQARHCKGLALVLHGHSFELAVKEKTTRVPHPLTPAERSRRQKGYSYGIPDWDYLPTGNFEIRSDHGSMGRILASDGKRGKLEERLGIALLKLEEMAAEAEVVRQSRLRAEAELEQRRHAALAHARERHLKQWRISFLTEQVDQMRLARDARELVAEAEARATTSEEREWLSWIVDYADGIDPLKGAFLPPIPPEPTPTELQRYMSSKDFRGW